MCEGKDRIFGVELLCISEQCLWCWWAGGQEEGAKELKESGGKLCDVPGARIGSMGWLGTCVSDVKAE